MGKGYITINRKLQKHWLWDDKPFSKGQAWIDMLMRARHTEEKKLVRGELLARKRGDVCCSLSYLAKEWGWSREKVRRFMAMLESDGMITLHATTHDTTITIENYDKYQFKRTTNEATDEATDLTTDLTTDEAQRNNDNKCINKCSNNKPKGSPLVPIVESMPEELQPVLWKFIQHRNTLKAPVSTVNLEALIEKLVDISHGDTQEAIGILKQSMANGWKIIKPLEKQNSTVSLMDRIRAGEFDE